MTVLPSQSFGTENSTPACPALPQTLSDNTARLDAVVHAFNPSTYAAETSRSSKPAWSACRDPDPVSKNKVKWTSISRKGTHYLTGQAWLTIF